jgi:hypothetical protein
MFLEVQRAQLSQKACNGILAEYAAGKSLGSRMNCFYCGSSRGELPILTFFGRIANLHTGCATSTSIRPMPEKGFLGWLRLALFVQTARTRGLVVLHEPYICRQGAGDNGCIIPTGKTSQLKCPPWER